MSNGPKKRGDRETDKEWLAERKARTCEYCGWEPGCGRDGCRVCDHGYYG
jgi:hypothetical protein